MTPRRKERGPGLAMTQSETERALQGLLKLGLVETRLRPDGEREYRRSEEAARLEEEHPELLDAMLRGECIDS